MHRYYMVHMTDIPLTQDMHGLHLGQAQGHCMLTPVRMTRDMTVTILLTTFDASGWWT